MSLRFSVPPGRADALEAALAAAREARRRGESGLEIVLGAGRHFIEKSVVLTARDSGMADDPLVIRAETPGTVRLIGGRLLSRFTPVTDPAILARLPEPARGRAMCCDLKAEGIADFGEYRPRGHGSGTAHAPLELFFNGRVMTVARWPKAPPLPNRGFVAITDFRDGRLHFDDPRPRRWRAWDAVHLHGYFALDWASGIVRVTDYDPVSHSVACDPPGVSSYGARKGGRFFFFNVLDELEAPGEWFLDRSAGLLYFIPPGSLADGEAIVSTLDGPLFRLEEASHVRIEGFALEAMRGDGIEIRGGAGVTVGGCLLRNIGRHGLSILGGTDHAVWGCDIHDTGECGIDILAGDRRTLTPCRHRVHNCHLHHIGREGWTYCDAIRMAHNLDYGCGVILTHNRLHDHRHALVHYKGNDHLIERNEFYNMGLEGDDCGALYTGRDFAMQGNVVRHNYFHHACTSGRNDWGTMGVYMDDCGGGTEVAGNIFLEVDKAVLAGGGINIRIHDNLFIRCRPAVWFDERGASAGSDGPRSMVHDTMRRNVEHVNALMPGPYAKYANMDRLARAFREHLGVLTWGAGVYRNVIADCPDDWLATSWTTYPDHFEFHENWTGRDPGFRDPDFGLFALRDDSPARAAIGIGEIPVESIGLQRDRYRPKLLDAHARLVLERPPGGRGEAGLAWLEIRNDGDLPAAGEEIVEFKSRRHGPGFAFVRVPYQVAPGATARFAFEIALDPEAVAGQPELFMCSRGEGDVRPVWASLPVAFGLTASLQAVETPSADGEPARVRLRVRNGGTVPADQSVELTIAPAESVAWRGERRFQAAAADGGEADWETAFSLSLPAGAPLVSRVTVEAGGVGVRPARIELMVRYPLARFPAVSTLEEAAARLTERSGLPVRGQAKGTRPGYYGEIRLAVAGDALLVGARIPDPTPVVTPLIWDGSSVELYGCSPDRERLHAVFGAIPIGQVYLVPGADGGSGCGLVERNNAAVAEPSIRTATRLDPEGYELTAIVPLTLLGVGAGSDRFLFEVQVNTPRSEGGLAGRGNLFGSFTAFNDSSRYGLAVVSPQDRSAFPA